MNKLRLITLIATMALYCGCVTSYMVTHFASPDQNCQGSITLRGSFSFYGSPLDEGGKRVGVEIVSGSPAKSGTFFQNFHIYGSHIQWHDIWDEHDNLSLLLYDFGPNVGTRIARSPQDRMHYVCTIEFNSVDGKITKVVERKPGTVVDWTNNVVIWGN
jgi:hypothetical protein